MNDLRRRVKTLERALDARKREISELRLVNQLAHRWDYGSLTPTIGEWGTRWKSAELRILFFAPRDHSGTAINFVASLNRLEGQAARLVGIYPHPYGYPGDIIDGAPTFIPDQFEQLLAEADVVFIRDEGGFFTGDNLIRPDLFHSSDIRRVLMLYGGLARRLQDDPEYRRYVNSHDAVHCLTPDLCFDWIEIPMSFVPHTLDVHATPTTWRSSDVVGHSPSTRERKATAELIEAAARTDITLEIIEGVSNAECLARKANVGFFFDQAGVDALADNRVVGWYGMSGLEAIARGIPTLAHLSESARAGAARCGQDVDRCPVIDTGTTPESIETALRRALALNTDERAELSRATRLWAETFHDYSVVAPQLLRLTTSVVS